MLDWIGGEMADSGMPWGGGVKLDCGGGLGGRCGGFKMVLGGRLAGVMGIANWS